MKIEYTKEKREFIKKQITDLIISHMTNTGPLLTDSTVYDKLKENIPMIINTLWDKDVQDATE